MKNRIILTLFLAIAMVLLSTICYGSFLQSSIIVLAIVDWLHSILLVNQIKLQKDFFRLKLQENVFLLVLAVIVEIGNFFYFPLVRLTLKIHVILLLLIQYIIDYWDK